MSKKKDKQRVFSKAQDETNKKYASITTQNNTLLTDDEFNNKLLNSPDFQDFLNDTGISNPSDTAKELFSIKNPKAKSDLSQDEISYTSRLYFLARKFHMTELSAILDEFIVLRISKERKSREEFVKAFQSADEMNKKAGLFGGLVGAFGNKGQGGVR